MFNKMNTYEVPTKSQFRITYNRNKIFMQTYLNFKAFVHQSVCTATEPSDVCTHYFKESLNTFNTKFISNE